jgi:hypothetical protein
MQQISEEPSTYFPYLDMYAVLGIHSDNSFQSIIMACFVALAQIVVPLCLLYQIFQYYHWKKTTDMGMNDDDGLLWKERDEVCYLESVDSVEFLGVAHASFSYYVE